MQIPRSLCKDKSDRRENMAGSVSFGAGAILTVQEVAAILKVPNSWIYDHVRPGCRDPLPFFKMGKYLRFSAADLQVYLDARRRLQRG
ncbi:MAG: hypothetical protein DMG09_29240 [Acidobacteria bacterium]|nr:MAG: hypothetical protein DMG09_29240 [Acidobacteriota bacterium]